MAIRSRYTALALVASVALTNGCLGGNPDFFTLSPSAAAGGPSPVASLPELGLAVGPLSFPRYLDRPQLVTRDGSHRLIVDDDHRWGDTLRTEVLRVVADARGQGIEHVARITTENARRFFSLPPSE